MEMALWLDGITDVNCRRFSGRYMLGEGNLTSELLACRIFRQQQLTDIIRETRRRKNDGS